MYVEKYQTSGEGFVIQIPIHVYYDLQRINLGKYSRSGELNAFSIRLFHILHLIYSTQKMCYFCNKKNEN